MFGKRYHEGLTGRAVPSSIRDSSTKNLFSVVSDPTNLLYRNRILLDFILAHAKGDQRPYLRVQILGLSALALLDSGALRTVVGAKGKEKFPPQLH